MGRKKGSKNKAKVTNNSSSRKTRKEVKTISSDFIGGFTAVFGIVLLI